MTLPSGYNAKALSPTVRIYDTDDVLQYEFESEAVGGVTRDFNLTFCKIHQSINDDFGYAELLIDDHNNILVESTSDKTSKIKNQWRIDIYLGKGVEGDKWFRGRVQNTDVNRPGTQDQILHVFCVGWFIISAERISKIERVQKRLSNGLDYDTTDTITQVDNLFKDIWEDTDHYVLRSLGTVSGIDLSEVQSSTLKLTEFKEYYQSWAFLMSKLAASSNRVFGAKPDLKIFFRDPNTLSSGLLLSAKESSPITKMWNPSKLCYISGNINYLDQTGDSGYSVIHAPGAANDSLDINVNPTVDAQYNMYTNGWLAVEFIPNQSNLAKIAARFARPSGATTAQTDAFFRIVGENSINKPDINDTRARVRIPKEKINQFIEAPSSSIFTEFSFERKTIEPDNRLFFVVEKYGTGSTNSFGLDYDSLGSNIYYSSSDGVTWGAAQNGDFAFRTYPFRTFNLIYQNTVARRKYGIRETVIDIKNFTDFNTLRDTMIGLGRILAQSRRVFMPVTCSVPDNYPEVGKTVRIIDQFGLDQNAVITGWDIQMSANTPSQVIGASEMTFQLEVY